MKVLLIGMDGASVETFMRGWTPFIASLIKKGKRLNLRNDLVSRGWLEIATGHHASVTGAMYDMPKINGTHQWNLNFSINDIPGINSSVKPLWQVLNEQGYSVGVMNLPTVYPAPKVNGFFVSGGGGGAPVVEKPIPELCHPSEILATLEKNDYIVDERIVQLVVDKKLDTPDLIFDKLSKKNEKRTASFVELAKQYNIDFGFVVYKTSSVTAETIVEPEWKIKQDGRVHYDVDTIGALKRYYEKFDKEIKKLHHAFPEAELILVSDHGSISRTNSVNLNNFLQLNKFQIGVGSKNIRRKFIEKIKKIIPFSIKVKLQRYKPLKSMANIVSNFDVANSLAFSYTKNDWNHGIYINDKVRFGGPVDPSMIESITENIISCFNSNDEARKHNLYAYSKNERQPKSVDFFPDIIIDRPQGYLTNNAADGFISEFKRPKGVSSLGSILRGDIITIKSHEPLAVDCGNSANEYDILFKDRDLTAIYDLVLSKFGINNQSAKEIE